MHCKKILISISNQVLVRGGTELESVLLFVVSEPAPAATLDRSSALLKPFFKLLKAVPGLQNVPHQLSVVVWPMTVFRST